MSITFHQFKISAHPLRKTTLTFVPVNLLVIYVCIFTDRTHFYIISMFSYLQPSIRIHVHTNVSLQLIYYLNISLHNVRSTCMIFTELLTRTIKLLKNMYKQNAFLIIVFFQNFKCTRAHHKMCSCKRTINHEYKLIYINAYTYTHTHMYWHLITYLQRQAVKEKYTFNEGEKQKFPSEFKKCCNIWGVLQR